MIYVTGDLHGFNRLPDLGSEMWEEGNRLTKTDYLIICGDFGLVWKDNKQSNEWLDWLDKRSWTTLFVDGNHENFNMLNAMPQQDWLGGKVHVIRPSILHLMRGQVFNIEGKKFFTFGGATSIDKEWRKPNVSWWVQEVPNQKEVLTALNNLAFHNGKIDYILTHTAPNDIIKIICGNSTLAALQANDPVSDILDKFYKITTFDHWYFGHFHEDRQINNKFTVMYENIERIV